MIKKIAVVSLFISIAFLCALYAQEELTITTYYPSPSGSYHHLESDELNVGAAYRGRPTPANGMIVQGNVGIGTTNPGNTLDVIGGAAFQGNHIYVRNPSSPAGTQTWGIVVNQADGSFNLGQATDVPPAGGLLQTRAIRIEPGAASNTLFLDSNDNVGIGTSSPRSKLDVRGGVRIDDDAGVCNVNKAGTMRYRGGVIQFCDGAAWRAMGENRFGGIFEVVQWPGREDCATPNPLTGSCTCPPGFTRQLAHNHAPGYPVFACYPN